MVRYLSALGQLLVQFSPWRNVKPLHHHLQKIPKMIQRGASFWWFWKCTAWIIEFFGSDQQSTFLYIFLMTFLVMEWCVCDGWASCLRILEFFESTACPCKFSSGQLRLSDGIGSKFHILQHPRFPEACLQTSEFLWSHTYFAVLLVVLSRHKLSCKQFSSQFSLTTFTTHSSSVDWFIMMASTLSAKVRFCVADKQIQYFEDCSGCQWIWWLTFLDFFVSVITSASLALLSRQIVHSPW